MNDIAQLPTARIARPRARADRRSRARDSRRRLGHKGRADRAGRLLGLGVLLMLAGALGIGGWRYYSQHREVMADGRAAPRLRPERSRGDGAGERPRRCS